MEATSKVKSTRSNTSQFGKIYSFFKSNVIVTSLLFVLVVTFVFKYYEDVHGSYSNFKKTNVDIYSVLEVPKDAKEPEIKAKYRELSLKWHPDKNKDCVECEERFRNIKEAYKIILNPHLREMYDKTKGHTVDMIPSRTTDLTVLNFDKLVKNSKKIWVVLIYSDDSHRCRSFAPVWDEFASKFEKYAKFGRVNALLDEKLLSRLPTKPLLHPSIFLLFPDKKYDLVPTGVMDTVKSLSRYFYENYPFYGTKLNEYAKFHVLEGTRLLFYSNKKNVPFSVKLMALKFHRVLKVYFVSTGDHYSTDELLLNDMKSAKSLPKVPEKLELFDLFVGLYEGPKLRYFAYQLSKNLPVLQATLYSLLSLNPFDLNDNTYDVLCSRHSAKDRVCLMMPGNQKLITLSSEAHEMPDVTGVYGKYESYGMLLPPEEDDEPEVVEEGEEAEKEQSKAKEKLLSLVDLQFLSVKTQNKHLQQLYLNFSGSASSKAPLTSTHVLAVNKNKELYTVFDVKKLDDDFINDLLNNESALKWLPLPATHKGGLFKSSRLNAQALFDLSRIFHK
ncbi:molecular chaperone protein DnaJ [Theileria orientalis strain Shintoku]|uniref:Molecular chaperone protein DnaJ n=1 Tax=Theileria orientalis strain Shintoku TaxID=869250 RepID=J4C888_THEOR|nr:molecular chaperone protein DnaJ [Theileria orientalis strain Shintoku]BAM40363.1 molecular chaperone protein DnaJ [Theileria orientalis strain Shintoku]|eukprot:XP_009690664.1 molecular chaperone protein DnaJ [Theileria orientalis strain Shintoku]